MKERLRIFLEQKGLTPAKLATMINANPSAISHILNGRNKMGSDMMMNFAETFPEVNMNWFLTGNGEMFGEHNNNKPTVSPHNNIQQQVDMQFSSIEQALENKQGTSKQVNSELQESFSVNNSYQTTNTKKKIKRILLFFEDGSFEGYEP
ncbi:MAG: helix-turn-helix domain-containing protein [Culturomica sp.]|nr:helix-turn-helix domain-containing protein [Culturomica sp.]